MRHSQAEFWFLFLSFTKWVLFTVLRFLFNVFKIILFLNLLRFASWKRLLFSWGTKIFLLLESILIKMNIKIISCIDKSHLILTFVKEGKICTNKIVNLLKLINSWQLDNHCLQLRVKSKDVLTSEFFKILFENFLLFSSWLSIS